MPSPPLQAKEQSAGRQPQIFPQIILPAIVSGVLWGIASIAWFVANDDLGFAVAFPIITSGPGLVAALWGIFLFGEIRGKRNYGVLACAAGTNITAGVIIALSK